MLRKEIKHKTFERITYVKTGFGPAILLVHGFPANVHLWRHIIPELSLHYTLLLPDFFGDEGIWLKDGTTSMDLLAEAFDDILVHEGISKVLIAGHSMGGYMGLAFAQQHAQKVAGLSLIHSSPLADDEARAEGRRKTIAILERGGKAPFLKKMVRALFPEQFNRDHPEVCQRQTEEALAVNDQSLIAFYRAIMQRKDTSGFVRHAGFPVQNIIGRKDSLANITKELAPQNLANTNFVRIYHDEGHMAMLENPALLFADLLHFAQYCWGEKT